MQEVRKIEMNYSEKWGKDVEEAVRLALADLETSRDQVDVVVLEEPSKGFFGIGSKLAKVRVQMKPVVQDASQKDTDQKAKQKKEASIEKKEQGSAKSISVKAKDDAKESLEQPEKDFVASQKAEDSSDEALQKSVKKKETNSEHGKKSGRKGTQIDKRQFQNESRFTIRRRPDNLTELTDHPVITFLQDVIGKMGLSLTVSAYHNHDSIYLDIEGKDSGTIIGKRGQTLDAIQYLSSLVANKDSEKYIRVVVDAENYRDKREKTLEQLADRLANKVKQSGKSVRLEPMNPYERKVIHAVLQNNPMVTTRSEGEEPYRRVIIELK